MKWEPLRVVQGNVVYKVSEARFVHAMRVIGKVRPDLVGLNEMSSRRNALRSWARNNGFGLYHPVGPGATDDQAILWLEKRFTPRHNGVKKMNQEPPGKPAARYACHVILHDRETNRYIIKMAFHALSAVERKGKLNPIPRTTYYVKSLTNVTRYAISLQRLCKKQFGRYGQVILTGDLNWNWTHRSWIQKRMGRYWTSNHKALGLIKTLGSRGVDVVLKHGKALRFRRQRTVRIPSDHRLLVVDMEISDPE